MDVIIIRAFAYCIRKQIVDLTSEVEERVRDGLRVLSCPTAWGLSYCVGELRFMENLYVYAVPYCREHDVFVGDLHIPMARFIAERYKNANFTVENFCDDEPKLITTHVRIGGGGDEVLEPFDPSRKEEREEWWRKRNEKMLKRFGTTDIHPERDFV